MFRGLPVARHCSFRANYLRDDTVAAVAYSVGYTASDCDRVRTLPPSKFVVTLDRMKVNEGPRTLFGTMNVCVDFAVLVPGDQGVELNELVKKTCKEPVEVKNGTVVPIDQHTPIFDVASQNGVCFYVYVYLERKYPFIFTISDERWDPICYDNGEWRLGIGSKSMRLITGGLDAEVFYTIEKQ